MANATANTKVWVIDTSSSTVAITRERVAVVMVRWAASTVGDAYLTDVNDNVLWRATHTASQVGMIQTDFSKFPQTAMNWNVNGLMSATLNSGKLYIYLA